jgi:alkanesulfonate monooxygenase SsuD/methylene tetrahydromethanopterin reductase-like flavin-dependent oxidoreductase (luciferase family)
MHVGYSSVMQGLTGAAGDTASYAAELRLAEGAEPLGFQSIWTTEHHFTDYSLSPNPFLFLSYMAARTQKAQLGTMVVVLPWHDPLRVAEEIAVLDHLSGGRVVLGIGRGVSPKEYSRFQIDMSHSRGRFVEAAEMIIRAFESGSVEYNGKHFTQPNAPLRPAPLRPLNDRLYAAAVSPESAEIVAKLGAGLLIIPQKPWEDALKDVNNYRGVFQTVNGREAPQPIAVGWVVCDRDKNAAFRRARDYIGAYYRSALWHYEMKSEQFAAKAGYEYYDQMASKMRGRSEDKLTDYFMDMHPWGTPDDCYNKIAEIHGKVNNSGFVGVFSFGGMPYEEARANRDLFAEAVLPQLKALPAANPTMAKAS